MKTETPKEQASYLVQESGEVVLNGAGVELVARYRQVQAEQRALDASWAGAVLAGLFHEHAWLSAVTLSFTITSEYDDSGKYFRDVCCQAEAVRAVPQASLPVELFPDGEFDPDEAEQFMNGEIEDLEWDLYGGLTGNPEGYDDLNVKLERRPIEALLTQCPIDGHLAFRAWGLNSNGAA